jgi:hypothetical protein
MNLTVSTVKMEARSFGVSMTTGSSSMTVAVRVVELLQTSLSCAVAPRHLAFLSCVIDRESAGIKAEPHVDVGWCDEGNLNEYRQQQRQHGDCRQ